MNDVEAQILVQVVPEVAVGREISWGSSAAERLEERLDDVRRAIEAGASAVSKSLGALPAATNWRLEEVSATFGVTLTAEAGVLLSKASAGATFEIAVKYERVPASQ
jgi:hypothetical protein